MREQDTVMRRTDRSENGGRSGGGRNREMTGKAEREAERQDGVLLERSGYMLLECGAVGKTELHPGDRLPFRYAGVSLSMEIDEETVLPQTEFEDGETLLLIGLVNGERCVAKAAVPRPYYELFRSFSRLEEKANAVRRFASLPEETRGRLIARLNGERYPIAHPNADRAEKLEDLRFQFELCRDTYTPQQQLDIETIFGECGPGVQKRELKAERRLRYLLNIDQSSAREFTLTKEEIIRALDERLYRLDAVKEKIAEAIVAAKYARRKGFEILLVGSPGVGKTSIIRAVAEVLGRPYFLVSLGSSTSLIDLIGDAPHYESSDCGEIIKNFYKIGTTEAVVGLDEFDKPYQSEKEGGGKNTKAFNDALSDEHMFRDVFLGTGVNTKNTLFIATANTTETIADNLLNRFVVIQIPDYTEEEKVEIARRHILPELFREYGIEAGEIEIDRDVLLRIAHGYCEDEGARDMKKHLRSIVDRILTLWDSTGIRAPFPVTEEFVKDTLTAGVDENAPAIVFRRSAGAYSAETAAEIRSLIGKCRRDDLAAQEREQYTKRLSYLTRLIPCGDAFGTFDVEAFYRRVNETHCGMEDVKDAIAQVFYLSSLNRRPLTSVRILLVGPPGVGKTSIVRSLAESCGAQYQKLSLNGVSDDVVLKGHSPTYVGSDAGLIVKALYRMKTTKGILLLDEIDKLGSRGGAEASNTLVDLLDDSAQFTDHFLGVPVDLSQTLFLATANDLSAVPPLLRDRFTVITLEGYSEREKEEILGGYIIPRVTAEYCPRELDVRFPRETQSLLLSSYCGSMGVRDADRLVRRLVREKLFSLRGSGTQSASVTPEDVCRVLGSPPPRRGNFPGEVYPGLTRALAVTGEGCGMAFSVETMLLPGESGLTLTGLPKESTADSVRLAVSFVKRRWPGALRDKGIHVHFGEGAVEKDGPSAGIAILLSLLSAVFGEKIDGSATYTGEINGNGCVFCIGGMRAKLRAAEQAGCTRVFLPYDNFRELSEKELAELRVEVIPVRHVDEVIRAVLPGLGEKELGASAR